MRFNNETTLEQLFLEVKRVQDNGDLVFIKFDGEREINHITIIISFNPKIDREQIRFEGDNLRELLKKALLEYHN